MSSIDPAIELEIYRLSDEGMSARQIAKQLPDVSRATVQRKIKARREFGLEFADEDFDDDEVVVDTYEPSPPFKFTGLAAPEGRDGEPLRDVNGRRFPPEPRALDGKGVSTGRPELEIRRWCWHREAEGDYEGSERVWADWERQLAEAGVAYDDTRRRWVQDLKRVI